MASYNPQGQTGQGTPVITGAPNDFGGPQFMTIGNAVERFIERNVPEILDRINKLSQTDYIAPKDVEGVLVPWDVYTQLTAPEGRKGINFKQLRKGPSAEDIDGIVEGYVAIVEPHGQEDARTKLKARLKERDPRLVATLDARIVTDPTEAAPLFGMEYHPPEAQ